jgi:hypothetical protein
MPDLMWRAGMIIADWYKLWLPQFNPEITKEEVDEHLKIIDVMTIECIHAVELCGNTMYMSIQGNKSGNPWTALINTLVGIMYAHCTWRELCRDTDNLDLLPLSCFDDHVKMFAYGDDNIFAVSDEALTFFHAKNYAECMKRHGVDYTNESKKGEIIPFRRIDECTFLKNGFRPEPRQPFLIHPTMSLETIMHLTNWIRRSPSDWDALYANLNDALSFIFHYGEEDFQKFKLIINKSLISHNMPAISAQYEDLYDSWINKFVS